MTTNPAGPRLLGPAEVRPLAAELDLRPTKQRGQNFVIDANTVRRIVRESGITGDDVVVEVGPGLGSLTLALLEVARRVIAIEVDPLLAERLPATIASYAPGQADRFEVVLADAMRVDAVPGPPPTALVANLPYNVSVPVLIHLLTLLPSLERGLVMVQAEVADRLAAPPGSKTYGVPSVKAAWFADVRRAGAIGRNVFWPAPNVDSGLVAWTRREPPDTTATRQQVFAVVDAAFAQRRKQVRAALRGLAGSADDATAALEAAGVDPTARGEVLDVARLRAHRRGLGGHARLDAGPGRRVSTTVRAAAKINLHLGVGAPREDGFHPLDTVYQAISLYDDVTVSDAGEDTLSVAGTPHIDVTGVPTDATNIAMRALAEAPCGESPTTSRSPSRSPSQAGWRAAPPTARPPCSRTTGCTTWASPTTCSSRRPPGSAATCRSPSWEVRRGAGAAARSSSRSSTTARGGGSSCRLPSASRRRRSTATSTGCTPTPRRSPPSRRSCWPRWRAASPSGWRARSTTTCRSRPSTCDPSSAT